MDVVVFDNVTKIYGGLKAIKALDNASFRIPSRVVAGLLGPNGSGKTTSFKLIMGFLKPNSGKISVFGMDPWVEEYSVRRRIGYLPEKPVYPYVSVYKFLKHIGRMQGVSSKEVEMIIKLVGLERYKFINIRGLSRGYLQRLGLAQALIGDPELLLLDEPTANLDPLSRKQILDLIKDLKKELGITILVATHILPELQEVADYLVYINRGRVIESGKLEDLTHRYFVHAYYYIETGEPRKIASKIIMEEYVKAIEVRDNGLLIKINSAYKDDLLELLTSSEISVYVKNIRHVTTELGELYEKLSRAS